MTWEDPAEAIRPQGLRLARVDRAIARLTLGIQGHTQRAGRTSRREEGIIMSRWSVVVVAAATGVDDPGRSRWAGWG